MATSLPFYDTPAKFINNHRFLANVPFSYQPNMPLRMRQGKSRNIVNYADPLNRQHMRITIAQMLELFEDGHEFTLSCSEDSYIVFRTIDFWILGALEHIKAKSLPHIVYANRLVAFRDANFVAFQLAVLSNDGIMDEVISIYGRNSTFDTIFADPLVEQIPETASKSETVKFLLKKIRKAPIDPALIDTTRIVEKPKVETSLDALLPDDGPLMDEDFISSLYTSRKTNT